MKVEERKSLLQPVVNFQTTNDLNRLTILLNNVSLICVLDWWLEVLGFI